MLVQTERNQARLFCWGAAEYRRWSNLCWDLVDELVRMPENLFSKPSAKVLLFYHPHNRFWRVFWWVKNC